MCAGRLRRLYRDGGALTLTNVETYTGVTTISSGTLTIGGSGQLGSGSYGGQHYRQWSVHLQ